MRIYIAGNDGVTLCGETPAIVRKPERGHATLSCRSISPIFSSSGRDGGLNGAVDQAFGFPGCPDGNQFSG